MAKKAKNKPWFIRVRGSYLPQTWQGWLTYLPYAAYLILAIPAAFNVSADGTLNKVFNLAVYWVAGAGVMSWIASKKV